MICGREGVKGGYRFKPPDTTDWRDDNVSILCKAWHINLIQHINPFPTPSQRHKAVNALNSLSVTRRAGVFSTGNRYFVMHGSNVQHIKYTHHINTFPTIFQTHKTEFTLHSFSVTWCDVVYTFDREAQQANLYHQMGFEFYCSGNKVESLLKDVES